VGRSTWRKTSSRFVHAHPTSHTRPTAARKSFGFSAKDPLEVLGKGYITKGTLDTRWCHYQTLAPTQKGEKPAPGDENERKILF
jgi:hypothetical protein